jgi:modulator of FtsH protease
MPYNIDRQLDPNTGTWASTIDVPREEAASLLSKVLAITSLGFLITAVGVQTAPAWSTLPGVIAVFALVLVISFTRKASPALALGLFMVLTYFMGWEIGPLIHRYVLTIGPAIVFQAAATTGLGKGCHGIVGALFHFLTPDAYSWMTLGVFTLLIVGDFARIRAGGGGASAVQLSLSIYLDAINVFLAILQLMGGRRRD